MTGRQQTPEAELDRRIEFWLDEGPDRAPDALLASTLAPIPVMAQRRRSLVALGRLTVRVEALARLAVAAALVIAVAGIAGFAVRGGPSGAGPTSSASPSPTAAQSPLPLPSGVSFTNAGPLGVGTGREAGKAGTYQTLIFRPVVRFTVPAGWSVNNIVNTFVGGGEELAGIPIGNGDGVIVVTAPTTVDPPAPGDPGSPVPADLLAWLATDTQLTLTSGPTPVTIGGIGGNEIEGSLAATARLDPVDGFYRPVDWLPLLPRHHLRIAVVQVGGQQVLVATVANADVFETFRVEADAVIGSFEFPDFQGPGASP
ncbi:MAG TPA: hypothetical protein VEX41_09600 [Candidatus Eisenbacteria bacterium]|nr:hypothetical protein [Candidatus Eisenbacteria bacterium]